MIICSRYNIATGDRYRDLHSLFHEIGTSLVLPSLLRLDVVSFAMAKTVCRAYGANYPLLVYGQADGK